MRPVGVQLRHTGGLKNQLWVVESTKHRYTDGGYDCNLCIGIHHYGKATHLWLEPDGTCLVSVGILKELKRAGMGQMEVIASISDPPPLRLGRDADRQQVDNNNRKVFIPGAENPIGRAIQAIGS